MRAVIQRVSQASVEVEGQVVGRIAAGLVVLLGWPRATPNRTSYMSSTKSERSASSQMARAK